MGSVRAFVVSTVCRSTDEFVERYQGRVEGRSIFVSAVDERALGGDCAFAILLADRRPILAGICEVIEVMRDAQNEFGRPGMRLGIARLGPDSEGVWSQLVGQRRLARGTTRLPIDDDRLDVTIDPVLAPEIDAIPTAVEDEDLGLSVAAWMGRSFPRAATS